MNLKRLAIAGTSAGLVMAFQPSCAQELSGEMQIVSALSRNKAEQRSLVETHAYLEAEINKDFSAFVVGYHDQEFKSATIGVARKLGRLQIGLGIGQAHYDNASHVLVNPLAYYSDGNYRAYLHVEHYGNDGKDPWFVRGYALWQVGMWSLGVYGDSDFGLGPRVDVKIFEHLSIWAALPAAFRPKEGAMQSMIGVATDF